MSERPEDARWMDQAIRLARSAVGTTAENPAVGCVIVRDGRVAGRGKTQPGGRPHAETEALARAGEAARGATAYVSLEPCAHHGRTPPCAEALIAAGIARVVVAVRDPDPRVDGGGIAKLRAAGIEVLEGVRAAEAREPILGFLTRLERGRPWLIVKTATSLDGRIATAAGHSKWITGEAARGRVHLMRAEVDAILTGAGTVRADDPALTVRLAGLEARQPLRVVVAGRTPIGSDSALVRTADRWPTRIYRSPRNPDPASGIEERQVAGTDGRPELAAVLADLAEGGIGRVMVEAGPGLTGALLSADLIDEIAWFRAPIVLGGDGLPAFGPQGHGEIGDASRWSRRSVEPIGPDILETYRRLA